MKEWTNGMTNTVGYTFVLKTIYCFTSCTSIGLLFDDIEDPSKRS